MDEAEANRLLEAAAAEHAAGRASYDQARAALADTIRLVAPALRRSRGWQARMARTTGYTRERIRQILDDDAH